jgi:hypothetical protein
VPAFKKLTDEQKLDAKLEILQVMKCICYPKHSKFSPQPTSSSVHYHIPQQFAYGMPPMSTSHFSQQTQSLLPHTPILPPTMASTSADELRMSTPATASVPSLSENSQMSPPYSHLYDMS